MSDRGDVLDVIDEVRDRLEAAGFDVYLGVAVDPRAGDPIPCVSVHMAEGGDRTVTDLNRVPVRVGDLSLAIEYWDRATEDPLRVGLEKVRDVRNAVMRPSGSDRDDSLGGTALRVLHVEDKVITSDRETLLTQTIVTIRY